MQYKYTWTDNYFLCHLEDDETGSEIKFRSPVLLIIKPNYQKIHPAVSLEYKKYYY